MINSIAFISWRVFSYVLNIMQNIRLGVTREQKTTAYIMNLICAQRTIDFSSENIVHTACRRKTEKTASMFISFSWTKPPWKHFACIYQTNYPKNTTCICSTSIEARDAALCAAHRPFSRDATQPHTMHAYIQHANHNHIPTSHTAHRTCNVCYTHIHSAINTCGGNPISRASSHKSRDNAFLRRAAQPLCISTIESCARAFSRRLCISRAIDDDISRDEVKMMRHEHANTHMCAPSHMYAHLQSHWTHVKLYAKTLYVETRARARACFALSACISREDSPPRVLCVRRWWCWCATTAIHACMHGMCAYDMLCLGALRWARCRSFLWLQNKIEFWRFTVYI